MRVTGIIAEYNPFHGGHQYQIARAKELSGADYCVVAMSGDFVQRGEPAVYSKYLRARAALACGADLVLEIPSLFATGSAEDFASCGVALLSGLGAVDTLCFGSECGDTAPLLRAARYLTGGSAEYEDLLREGIKSGLTWPAARSRALKVLGVLDPDTISLIESPNNLLGLEYCRALLAQNSALTPLAVLRRGNAYHDQGLENGQASASALRKVLSQSPLGLADPAVAPHIPPKAREIFAGSAPLFAGDFSALLNFAISGCIHEGIPFDRFEGISDDLARRLARMALTPAGWEGRIRQLKTRQYTYTRVSRALCHLLLGADARLTAKARTCGYAPYARVLGFNRSAAPLLAAVKQKTSIPLITKTADARKQLTDTPLELLNQDFHASHLWQSVYCAKYDCSLPNEFTQKLTIL